MKKKTNLTLVDLSKGIITDVDTMETRELTEEEKENYTEK